MNYYVIGGQYEYHYYGCFESLHAAKICATKNIEYWDNWQGWHIPRIFKESDVKCVSSDGMITYAPGKQIFVPKENFSGFYYKDFISKKWRFTVLFDSDF